MSKVLGRGRILELFVSLNQMNACFVSLGCFDLVGSLQ